jgi:RNA polymerase sigma-70 factor (ECF subfamily)
MDFLSLFGRPDGLRQRVEAHRTAMFRLACMWCYDRALADDLTQEAMAKALLHANQLRDPAKLRSWLYGILANCWHDHLRTQRPMDDIDSIDESRLAVEHTPEHDATRSQLAERVRAAVGRLPIGQREVLSLVDLGDCSYAEAAEALAIPIGTVMSRLCRARATLRRSLAQTVGVSAADEPSQRQMRRVK